MLNSDMYSIVIDFVSQFSVVSTDNASIYGGMHNQVSMRRVGERGMHDT